MEIERKQYGVSRGWIQTLQLRNDAKLREGFSWVNCLLSRSFASFRSETFRRLPTGFRKQVAALALCFLLCTAGCGEKNNVSEPAVRPTPSAGQAQVASEPAVKTDRGALLDQYFDQLKDRDVNYKKIGNILEQLITIEMAAKYPPDRYEILNGIEYQEAGGRTVGEFDVIVFNKKTGLAELIVEAKLSSNLEAAGKKASSQIKRFRSYRAEGKITKYHYIAHPERAFTGDHFKDVTIVRIGSSGGVAAGFDSEVDLTRDEADVLKERLLVYKGEATPGAKAAAGGTEGKYVGNKKSKMLHSPAADHLPGDGKRVYYESVEEAQEEGYKLHDCITEAGR